MISAIFAALLLVLTFVSYLLNRGKTTEKHRKISVLKLLSFAALAVSVGLTLGSLSLNTFEISNEKEVLPTLWFTLKPYMMTLGILVMFEFYSLKKQVKC